MIAEIAVEPAAIASSVHAFNNIIDRFGIDRGRVISDYAGRPGAWVGAVYKAAKAQLTDGQLKVVTERLSIAQRNVAILRLRDDYRTADEWLVNVKRSQAAQPWDGIISFDGRGAEPTECSVDAVSSGIEWLRDQEPPRVARTTEALIAMVGPLLAQARRVMLVDPHITFDSTAARRRQWLEPIAAYIRAAASGRELGSVSVHTAADSDTPRWQRRPPANFFADACRGVLQPALPRHLDVSVSRWRERTGGELLHERLILSEVGGFRIESGLDTRPGDTSPVIRLSRMDCDKLMKRYLPATSPYLLADMTTVKRS